jgi:hypothetical protein
MKHEPRVSRGDVLNDCRVSLLVADHVFHRGQTAGHSMKAVGDAAAEWDMMKD